MTMNFPSSSLDVGHHTSCVRHSGSASLTNHFKTTGFLHIIYKSVLNAKSVMKADNLYVTNVWDTEDKRQVATLLLV